MVPNRIRYIRELAVVRVLGKIAEGIELETVLRKHFKEQLRAIVLDDFQKTAVTGVDDSTTNSRDPTEHVFCKLLARHPDVLEFFDEHRL